MAVDKSYDNQKNNFLLSFKQSRQDWSTFFRAITLMHIFITSGEVNISICSLCSLDDRTDIGFDRSLAPQQLSIHWHMSNGPLFRIATGINDKDCSINQASSIPSSSNDVDDWREPAFGLTTKIIQNNTRTRCISLTESFYNHKSNWHGIYASTKARITITWSDIDNEKRKRQSWHNNFVTINEWKRKKIKWQSV
jgi:hypothetical protein